MKNLRFVLALACAAPVATQDRIVLVNGDVIENAKIQSFDIMQLKYTARGTTDAVSTDRVAKLDLEKFADVYKRGEASKDPQLYWHTARDRAQAKDEVMAQLGFVKAANLFLDNGNERDAFAALEEMQAQFPSGGLLPEVYRLKMETYLSKGPDKARDAAIVANKYLTDASTGAWPQGFLHEGEFFKILADGAAGGADPKVFQSRLRDLLGKVQGAFPMLANRMSVQLAHSLRTHGDPEDARKIYEDLAGKENADANTRAGAYLGLGHVALAKAGSSDRDLARQALLDFLRVRLETRDAWPVLQAEALYHAMLAAEKWQGEDWKYIVARCKFIVLNEYPSTEWASRAKIK
jgi:hypothetical protein